MEEIIHRNRRWLKLAGEDWGNAEMCWEAILAIQRPPAAPPKKGLFRQIARMHQAITTAIKGKPRRELQAEAQKLFKEANQFIRRDDWQNALPLLQKHPPVIPTATKLPIVGCRRFATPRTTPPLPKL